MSCPDIYINPTYWTTPHTAEYGNTAIDVGPGGTTFIKDATRPLQVTVRNHGTDPSPLSRLQLYWADPGTSFSFKVLIGQKDDISITGADGFGNDGSLTENFSFTPGSSVVWPNGGHVCLLARVQNTSSPTPPCTAQGFVDAAPATDARSAIRNIFVVAPTPKHKGPIPPGGGKGGMSFAFVAADPLARRDESRLEVRALDPRKDREQLQQLIADQGVFETLSRRNAKFAAPDAVLLGEGVERVMLPQPYVTLSRRSAALRTIPRIGNLGPLSNAATGRLLMEGTKLTETKRPATIKLAPGEMRQMIVNVIPKGDDEIYAVVVEHRGLKDRTIGGLVLLFVSPPSF